MRILISSCAVLFAATGCNLNLYKGLEKKKDKSDLDRANESIANGDGTTAEKILTEKMSAEEREALAQDPLGLNFVTELEKVVPNGADLKSFTMLSNSLGVKHGLDFLTFVKRIVQVSKDKSSQNEGVTSFFPLLPNPTEASIADLDKGVAIIEFIKNRNDNVLNNDQIVIQTVLALSSLAGSVRMLDTDSNNALSSSEIDKLSDADGEKIYTRLLRTRSVMKNLMANSYSEKLVSASEKVEDYMRVLESSGRSSSVSSLSGKSMKAAQVRAFLRYYL